VSGEDRSPKDGEGRSSLKPKRKRDIDSDDTAIRNDDARKGLGLPNGVSHSGPSQRRQLLNYLCNFDILHPNTLNECNIEAGRLG
jgi:hypothetical protein